MRNIRKEQRSAASIITKALEIYKHVDDNEKTSYVMNNLMKICQNHDKTSVMLLSINCNDLINNWSSLNKGILITCLKNGVKHDQNKHQALSFIKTICDNVNLANDTFFVTNMINILGNTNDYKYGSKLFAKLSDNQIDIICVCSMMKCLHKNNQFLLSRKLFDKIVTNQNFSHIKPDNISFILYLCACIGSNSFIHGEKMIKKYQLLQTSNIELINTMIQFYGAMGNVEQAKQLFANIDDSKKDGISVAAMMTCFNRNNQFEQSQILFHQVETSQTLKNIQITDVIFLLYLTSCIETKSCEQGLNVIEKYKLGIDAKSTISELFTTLIHFYGVVGDVEQANKIFNRIPNIKKENATFGAMMKCLNDSAHYEESIALFDKVLDNIDNKLSHIKLSNVMCTLYLGACIECKEFDKGAKMIQKCKIFIGNGEKITASADIVLLTALLHFYGAFGDIDAVKRIWNNIANKKKDIVCFGAMMKIFNQNGYYQDTQKLFEQMENINNNNCKKKSKMYYDIGSNSVVCNMYLNACIETKSFENGLNMIEKYKLNTKNSGIVTIELFRMLIYFYGSFGDIKNAKNVFFNLVPNDEIRIVCINAMLNAFNDCSVFDQAIEFYKSIENQTLFATVDKESIYQCLTDTRFWAIILNSCQGSDDTIGYNFGQTIINKYQILKNELLMNDEGVQSSLISFYCKYNDIENAIKIFDSHNLKITNGIIDKPSILVYQSIMQYFCKQGDANKVHQLFTQFKMHSQYLSSPQTMTKSYATFYCTILEAYGHNGMVHEAEQLFNEITSDGSTLIYDFRLISSMITCLGRKNKDYLDQAERFTNKYLPLFERQPRQQFEILGTLLSCCHMHNDTVIGKRAFDKMKQIQRTNRQLQLTLDDVPMYRLYDGLG